MPGQKRGPSTSASRKPNTEVLESACEESREVLEHQLSVQSDIDDKAIWSVRTAVLVLGLLLSAGSLGDLSQFLTLPRYVHGLAGFGVSLLLLSVFFGIGTYTMTETYPGTSHRRRMEVYQGDYEDDEWQSQLLHDYQLWITSQETWNERNGFHLFVTHVCLLGGTTTIVLAGVVSLLLSYTSGNGTAFVGGLLSPILVVVLLLRAK